MEILDEHGRPLPEDRRKLLRETLALVSWLTNHERSLVLCWFCPVCYKYIGPGESFCHTIKYQGPE